MLTKWNPLREMEELHSEMDRLFSRFTGNGAFHNTPAQAPTQTWPQLAWSNSRGLTGNWVLPLDVSEQDEGITLRAALPGIAPENIRVEVEDNVLTLRAERQFDSARENGGRHWVEQNYGTFSRSLTLPRYADTERIEAHYEHGVLQLTIPKRESARPRRIELQLGSGEARAGSAMGPGEAHPALSSGPGANASSPGPMPIPNATNQKAA